MLRGCEHADQAKAVLELSGRALAEVQATFAGCLGCLTPLLELGDGIDAEDVRRQVHACSFRWQTGAGACLVDFATGAAAGAAGAEATAAAVATFGKLQPTL